MARLLDDTRIPRGLLLLLVWLALIMLVVLMANMPLNTPLATNPPCDPGLGPVRVPDLSWFRAIRSNRI